jgi:hypothetical protein
VDDEVDAMVGLTLDPRDRGASFVMSFDGVEDRDGVSSFVVSLVSRKRLCEQVRSSSWTKQSTHVFLLFFDAFFVDFAEVSTFC